MTTNKVRSSGPPAVAIFAAALAIAATLASPVKAEDGAVQAATFVADQPDSQVEQVSYTVSESGHRYKWMPYQPKAPKRKREPLRAEAAQFTVPVSSETAESAASHPIDDPFGDRAEPTPLSPLPDVQQYLADDTNKKRPLDSLLISPLERGADAKTPSVTLPEVDLESKIDLPNTQGYQELAERRQRTVCENPDDILHPIDELNHLPGIRDAGIADPNNRPNTCDLGGGDFVPRQWQPTTFMWQASGLCHKPAYFEDIHLERYGHSWGPYVQPLMSGAHFFLNVPILPYKMGLYPPNECIYTLGYYRPGSCAPYMLDPLPLSVRAALAEAGVMTGMAYLIP